MEGLFSRGNSAQTHSAPSRHSDSLRQMYRLRESKNWMVMCLWNGLFWFHTQFLYRQELKRIKKEKESLTFLWPIRSKTLDIRPSSLLSVSSFLCSWLIENVSFPTYVCSISKLCLQHHTTYVYCICHSPSWHTVNSHLLMAIKPLKGSRKWSSLT